MPARIHAPLLLLVVLLGLLAGTATAFTAPAAAGRFRPSLGRAIGG